MLLQSRAYYMKPPTLFRTCGTITALALVLLASVPTRACMSFELNSVHFNANKPDFGLLPRRGSIGTRGEHDS